MSRVRVVVADRSPAVRAVLSRLLQAASWLEVVGQAGDGGSVLRTVAELDPDALVMDPDLPVLDGFEVAARVAERRAIPILVVTARDGDSVPDRLFRAAVSGVVEVLPKPQVPGEWPQFVRRLRERLRRIVDSSGQSVGGAGAGSPAAPRPGLRFVAIGASTGGPAAIYRVLAALDGSFEFGVAVVQHIASGFEGALAGWLRDALGLDVAIGRHGEFLDAGTVRFAPVGSHMLLDSEGRLQLDSRTPPHLGHRPSVDLLFRSLLAHPADRVAAVLLTGMGRDGAATMAELRSAGALTIAQSGASCAVYGMPRVAVENDAVGLVLAPDGIGRALVRAVGGE